MAGKSSEKKDEEQRLEIPRARKNPFSTATKMGAIEAVKTQLPLNVIRSAFWLQADEGKVRPKVVTASAVAKNAFWIDPLSMIRPPVRKGSSTYLGE
jgi:hypothetical protein